MAYTNAQGFNALLDSTGTNTSGATVQLDSSVLKFLADGVTKVMSNYLDPNEQIVADDTTTAGP